MRNANQELIWKSAEEKKVVVDFWPEALDIEVTSFCNLRCRMCPHTLLENKAAHHLNPQVIERLQPYLRYCRKVALQGDGEPFLNPHIEKIITDLSAAGVKLYTTTNLSIMNERLAKLINEAFDVVTISCDSCEKRLYELIRVNGSFDTFCSNLKLLKKHVTKPTLIMNCVMMRQNVHLAEDMVQFAKDNHIDRLVFSALLTDKDLANQADSLEHYPGITEMYLSQAEAKAREIGLDLQILWNYSLKSPCSLQQLQQEETRRQQCEDIRSFTKEEQAAFVKRYRNLKIKKTINSCGSEKYHCEGICGNLYGKSYIDAEGNVTLCCFGKIQTVGNILEQDFSDIWNGESYIAARNAFFSGNLPHFCVGCKYAISVQQEDSQPYPFRITDLDENFMKDEVFWENRVGRN